MPGTRKLWVCLVVGFKYCFLYLNTENGGPGWWVVCLALVFFNCIQILCLFYLKFIYLRTPFWCFQPNSNKWPVLKIMPQLSCIKLFIFSLSPQQYFLSLPLPQQIWELYHDDGAGSGLRPLPASMLAFLMGFGFDCLLKRCNWKSRSWLMTFLLGSGFIKIISMESLISFFHSLVVDLVIVGCWVWSGGFVVALKWIFVQSPSVVMGGSQGDTDGSKEWVTVLLDWLFVRCVGCDGCLWCLVVDSK